jgi:hypothetical protein
LRQQRNFKVDLAYVTSALVVTCPKRGACSFVSPRPSGLRAEELFLLFVYTFFEGFSTARPFLLQQVNNQLVHNFLSQQNTRLFLFSL